MKKKRETEVRKKKQGQIHNVPLFLPDTEKLKSNAFSVKTALPVASNLRTLAFIFSEFGFFVLVVRWTLSQICVDLLGCWESCAGCWLPHCSLARIWLSGHFTLTDGPHHVPHQLGSLQILYPVALFSACWAADKSKTNNFCSRRSWLLFPVNKCNTMTNAMSRLKHVCA